MLYSLRKREKQKGLSLIELVIVFLIASIIVVLALPRILPSRHYVQLTGVQKQVVSSLREARQEAMSQKTVIIFRYDDANKNIVIWGGNFGRVGDSRNRVVSILGENVQSRDVVYGCPSGAPTTVAQESANLTDLKNNSVDIPFQPDGSIAESGNDIPNKAIFFYNPQAPAETIFAVSIVGVGGRTKTWRYNPGANNYVE